MEEEKDEIITPEVEEEIIEDGASEINLEEEINNPDTHVEDEEPVLYELPDGRKVTGEELSREWKENFMPDYTRKSQELSEYKKAKEKEEVPEWRKEDYQPKTYAEIIEIAKQNAIETIEQKQREQIEARERISKEVENTIAKIKGVDKDLNENKLFEHAVKYGFKDLNLAYQNMKDMNLIQKTVEKKVTENVKNRAAIKVATGNTAKPGTVDDGIDFFSLNNETPQEALRRLRNN